MKRITVTGLLAGLALSISPSVLAEGRTDLEGPGDAEVIAGTGYEHTLFDSADNKCQHCHNDLYDTWKTSMHAKSWEDPIFQSKYQDFLRLQASKIGAEGPTGTYGTGPVSGVDGDGNNYYLTGTIQKTGQVCVKCHAPTAFYSSDYKITLTEVGDQNLRDESTYPDPVNDPETFEYAKANLQANLAGKPGYDSDKETTVASMAKSGKVYTVSYHIGNPHNREGINCSYCHSMETVRLMNDIDGDEGLYTLAGPIKMGPIGPIVREAGSDLLYSPDASAPDMNAFFALIGPDKGNVQSTAKDDFVTWDKNKGHNGRYVMKSTPTGCNDPDDLDGNGDKECHFTGGPFYGPFGVTGTSNSRADDATDRKSLVKQEFVDAVVAGHEDKFESRHQFAAYGKALCLSCHQRSSLMLNPESNGDAGVQATGENPDQFLELCSTWTAMSDGVGNNFEDTATSPKCQRCHMEPLEGKTVLHQWDQPDKLFTLEDNPDLTTHFQPDSGVGPVAEGYLNNHAFMGANTADFGTTKIKTGFESGMNVEKSGEGNKLVVKTYLRNKTAHMFPGAHPMRRVLTRVVVTDANDNKLSFKEAKGKSMFEDITNQVAVLPGNTIKPGFETVEVTYDKNSDVVIQGYKADLSSDGEYVNSQFMDQALFDWVSPDATVVGSSAVQIASGEWVIKGKTTAKLVTDIEGTADHFTRIYGRETGKRAPDGSHVVRPGFDSNIATDNRLKPNELEGYAIEYDTEGAVFPLTVKYKVYYLKKGGSGKFPTCKDQTSESCEYGFLDTSLPAANLKKLAIFEVFDGETTVTDGDGLTDQGSEDGVVEDPAAVGIDFGGSSGCTVSNTQSTSMDPIWLFLLAVSGMGLMRRQLVACKRWPSRE